MSASAAIVSGQFVIGNALITNLYSTSLQGPCPEKSPDGDFFTCSPDSPTGTIVFITSIGRGTGTLDIDYESTTGEIKTVNSMTILLPDMDIDIINGTHVEIRNGNNVPADPGGVVNNNVPQINAGEATTGITVKCSILDVHPNCGTNPVFGNGTADADQDTLFNTGASIDKFQHFDGPNEDAPDFSIFSDVVDSCTAPVGVTTCALIPNLSLDGVAYELFGTVNGPFGDSFTMTVETGNASTYTMNFSTVVPVPAAVWLFGSALGLLGWIRSRARA